MLFFDCVKQHMKWCRNVVSKHTLANNMWRKHSHVSFKHGYFCVRVLDQLMVSCNFCPLINSCLKSFYILMWYTIILTLSTSTSVSISTSVSTSTSVIKCSRIQNYYGLGWVIVLYIKKAVLMEVVGPLAKHIWTQSECNFYLTLVLSCESTHGY